jgi:hypothetical protein
VGRWANGGIVAVGDENSYDFFFTATHRRIPEGKVGRRWECTSSIYSVRTLDGSIYSEIAFIP